MGAANSTPNSAASIPLVVDIEFSSKLQVEGVIEAAEAAGNELEKIFSDPSPSWELDIKSKALTSPLIRAEQASYQAIQTALRKLCPNVPIISARELLEPYHVRKNYHYCWLVTTLDGTAGFSTRTGEFTVNVALIEDNKPVLGVVHVPCQRKTYWALKGAGAWLRSSSGQRRLSCRDVTLSSPGLTICTPAAHMTKQAEELVAMFQAPAFKQVGTALAMVTIVEGLADLYPCFIPSQPWDVAAADIIVREAGGAVVYAGACSAQGVPAGDWKDAVAEEFSLVYNDENSRNPHFIVFGKRVEPPSAFEKFSFSSLFPQLKR